jgi:hypothetical protein
MIKLSPSQLKVVEEFPGFLSNDDTEMTISGFAGSGKSFLVKYLADTCKKQEKVLRMIDRNQPVRKIHFTATTNKAAAVLQEMLGSKRYVQTIHKLLGLVVYNDRRTGKQKLVLKERTTNLSRSIVFIDEASMINYELLTIIRKLQKRFLDCKIVFIGDAYQLPPVLENVCPVFDPNATNVFFLKEIQRQLANNPIIQLSAKYRDVLDDHKLGWPTIPHDGKHIFYYPEQKPFCDQISSVYTQFHDPNDYKILAWSNDRVRSYNRWIRQLQGMTKPFQVGEVMVSNKPLCIGGALVDSTDSLMKYSSSQETGEKPPHWLVRGQPLPNRPRTGVTILKSPRTGLTYVPYILPQYTKPRAVPTGKCS